MFTKILLVLVSICIEIALVALVVMGAWNAVIAPIFGYSAITFGQALMVCASIWAIKILTK